MSAKDDMLAPSSSPRTDEITRKITSLSSSPVTLGGFASEVNLHSAKRLTQLWQVTTRSRMTRTTRTTRSHSQPLLAPKRDVLFTEPLPYVQPRQALGSTFKALMAKSRSSILQSKRLMTLARASSKAMERLQLVQALFAQQPPVCMTA